MKLCEYGPWYINKQQDVLKEVSSRPLVDAIQALEVHKYFNVTQVCLDYQLKILIIFVFYSFRRLGGRYLLAKGG
jgi:hypothetical protein